MLWRVNAGLKRIEDEFAGIYIEPVICYVESVVLINSTACRIFLHFLKCCFKSKRG